MADKQVAFEYILGGCFLGACDMACLMGARQGLRTPQTLVAHAHSLSIAARSLQPKLIAKPVPAGCYGLRVRPGRDWEYDEQHAGGWGLTIQPTAATRAEWIRLAVGPDDFGGPPCLGHHGHPVRHSLGGWWPSRSACVIWSTGEARCSRHIDSVNLYMYREQVYSRTRTHKTIVVSAQ
jgi:hypothetical protein